MSSPERVGVVGLGVNNRPLIPFLLNQGKSVAVFDRRSPAELERDLASMGLNGHVSIFGGPDYLAHLLREPVSSVYLTPGMKKFGPELDQLAVRGIPVLCETDLFIQECPAPIIGITGSAGKTTTTTLVGEALKRDGRRPVFVGGNIGQPLLPRLAEIGPQSWVVLELSSFQLDLVRHSPHGASILNLAPNHLDMHRDFEDYRQAKANVGRYQSKEDWLVLPYGDAGLANLVDDFEGRRVYFSLSKEIPHGAYLHDGQLWWRGGNGGRPVVSRSALKLIGEHNVANALAAIAMVASSGGDLDALGDVLQSFAGIPHRLEVVRQVEGVTYINDSIATAPDRTGAAIKAIHAPIVLILGGYDKKLNYDTLGELLSQSSVRLVVTLGETKNTIARAVKDHTDIPVVVADGFDDAVFRASTAAHRGDVVLLSPASASYDMFSNFEARGQRFRELVGMLNHNRTGLAE